MAVHPKIHQFGAFNQQEVDDTNIDIDQWRAGVGYNHEISPRADLLTRIAYEKFDAGSGLDFDGYSVEAGARAALTRSEEHTSELQSLMRNSYAVFCLKKKKTNHRTTNFTTHTYN